MLRGQILDILDRQTYYYSMCIKTTKDEYPIIISILSNSTTPFICMMDKKSKKLRMDESSNVIGYTKV